MSSLRILCAIALAFAVWDVGSPQNRSPEPPERSAFNAFLDELQAAHEEYVQGRPEAFKALWSRRPDVTIFGGFGAGERGWENVGPRLDWASAQFENGTRTREILSTVVTAELGYVVQLERVRYRVPGRGTPALLELRVTMIARKEPEGWRLVHRHADSQLTKKAPN
jgi:ketosteroid isomerase-like protein